MTDQTQQNQPAIQVSISESAVGFINGATITCGGIYPGADTSDADNGKETLWVTVYINGALPAHEVTIGTELQVEGESWKVHSIQEAKSPKKGKIVFEQISP